MEYLKVNGTEYPAHFCGKQIDREWDGRASKTVTLAMPYAQAVHTLAPAWSKLHMFCCHGHHGLL